MKIKACCNNCTFHQLNLQDTNTVFCRRYPPSVFMVPGRMPGQFGQMAVFPTVPRDWKCGEYENGQDNVLTLETNSK